MAFGLSDNELSDKNDFCVYFIGVNIPIKYKFFMEV